MKFSESGLSNNKLVEEAFNFSFANVMSFYDEVMEDFTRQINRSHALELSLLDADRAAGKVKPEDYKLEKASLDKMRDDQLMMGPQIVDSELKNNFKQRRLDPAQQLEKNSENPTPELLAAVILLECVRSPVDYQKLEKKFGDKVANLVAQVQHIDAYPGTRAANIIAADSEVKRAYMALLVSGLTGLLAQVKVMERIAPGQKVKLPDGHEENMFNNAKSLWGNDKKLDQSFIAAFNSAAVATASAYRMELDDQGDLELVKGNINPPGGPKTPGTPGGPKTGLGDDVF